MVFFSSSLSTLIIRSTSRKTTTTFAYTQQQRQRLHHFVHTQSLQYRNFSSTKISDDSFSSLHNDSNEIDDDDDEIIENEYHHHQKQQKQKQQKKINIAIVGLPNAGKSFLLNRICQSKHVAAVSKKRHTTRHGILGVRNMDETQLVFVDTPGFLRSKSDANSSSTTSKQNEKLMRSLVATAGAEINKADYTLLVLDSAANKMNFREYEDSLLILMWKGMFGDGQTHQSQLRQYNDSMNSIPALPPSTLGVILNKVDLVTPKKKLLDTATEIGSMALACIQYYYLLNNQTSLKTTGDNDINSELQKQLSVEDHIRNMKQNHPKWQKTKSENLIEKLEQELNIDPDEQKHLEEEINDDGLDGSNNGEDNDELSKAVDMPENFLQALNEPDKYFTMEMQQHYPDVFFTSAKHKDGIDDILNHLQKIAPIREWDYEGDDASPDRSPLQKVEEIIREKIYRAVHREIVSGVYYSIRLVFFSVQLCISYTHINCLLLSSTDLKKKASSS